MALYFVSVWPSASESISFSNIRLPGPSASRDSRWLPSFDSTSMFENNSRRWLLYDCLVQNEIQIHKKNGERPTFICNNFLAERSKKAEILQQVFFFFFFFFHNCFRSTLSLTS